jgi:formylmethanofuran dehydrogenase subunit E
MNQERKPPAEGIRSGIISEDLIQKTRAFHGHMCPGLAIGIRASEVALREIGPHSEDEEVVALVETDMCGVDAVQFLTGCTFGKGNLIHLDYGKNAFTFFRRSDGEGIRLVSRPGAVGEPHPEWQRLRDKMVREGLTPEEEERWRELHADRSRQIIEAPIDLLFHIGEPKKELPRRARIMDSLPCAECGELTMETRTRRFRGRSLCIPCFERLERR